MSERPLAAEDAETISRRLSELAAEMPSDPGLHLRG